jgi:serine/threonine protein kinase
VCHIYCQKDHWHPLSTRVVDHGLPGIVSSLQQTVIDSDLCRLVRHKNLVQFIGACSCWPKLCIVTELMASGSVRDVLEFRRCGLDIPSALKVFWDAARGMDFLHKYDNVIK